MATIFRILSGVENRQQQQPSREKKEIVAKMLKTEQWHNKINGGHIHKNAAL